MKINFEISWVSLWKIFLFFLLAVFMFLGRQVLLALFLALVVSSGLEVGVDFLERRKVPRIIGAVLIFLGFVVAIIGIFYAVIPLLVINLNNFLADISVSINSLWKQLDIPSSYYSVKPINNLINELIVQMFSGNIAPLAFLSQFFGGLALAFSVFAISFYLSLRKGGVENFIKAVFPADYENQALRIYERSRRKIGYWFSAQIILSLTMGFLVWLSLLILGVRYPVLLGMVAGIFELVPFVGPILAGSLAVLVALTTSLPLAFYALIVFLALQQLEGNVLVPLLLRHATGLHPVIVIIALLMGIEIGGALGAIVAVPAAAVLQEVVEELGSKKSARQEMQAIF